MPPELGARFPFSVDTWSLASQKKKYHFLTHAHKDHTIGIECHGCFPIYCSAITAKLLLLRHSKLSKSMFVELELEEPTLLEHAGESFTVTAYDANHCSGSIMLLFEGQFGSILHTGDCRLSKDCYSRLPLKWFSSSLDCIFLDCTFGKAEVKMPSRDDAIKQVKQCIWNHPETSVVYLACDLLGHEILLQCISATFGQKIYVNRAELPTFYATMLLVAPELLTEDPNSTRFHVCEGFPKLYEKARLKFREANLHRFPEPLFIRPSAQWYTHGERLEDGSGLLSNETIYPKSSTLRRRRARSVPNDAERDEYGVWHVCFSMHSSREELEMALWKLCPKQLVSTVPNCKSSDLGYENVMEDYPKNQLLLTVASKLGEAETLTRVSGSRTEISAHKIQAEDKADLSPILACSPKRNIPLFGRARDGLPPSPILFNIQETDPAEPDKAAAEKKDGSKEGDKEIPVCKGLGPGDVPDVGDVDEIEGDGEFGWWKSSRSTSATAGSNSNSMKGSREKGAFGESTRFILRSLHMAIPSPLPSLVEMARLLHTRKRRKFVA